MKTENQYTVTIEQDGNGNLANELDSILNAELSHNHCVMSVEKTENQKPTDEQKECYHITGLANLEEDDEFVIVRRGDGIDFDAGGNVRFNYCPLCGQKL